MMVNLAYNSSPKSRPVSLAISLATSRLIRIEIGGFRLAWNYMLIRVK